MSEYQSKKINNTDEFSPSFEPTGNEEIDQLMKEWYEEALPYLNYEAFPENGSTQLDGPTSVTLAQIEKKYTNKLNELRQKDD